MLFSETPVYFDCCGEFLLGICHQPDSDHSTGVVIVVGGPQYRVGSHRQFVLLSRALAERGIPVFRFDYRGMGDSSGRAVEFEQVDADIRAAIDTFYCQSPGLKKVVLWGLCDAASAIMMYASHGDTRVFGQILLNPWVRTENGMAKVYLKNYYAKRLINKELWLKIVRGQFAYRESSEGLISVCKKVFSKVAGKQNDNDQQQLHYTERMLLGMEAFSGETLVILSGNDLTADEFRQYVATSERWQALLNNQNLKTETLSEANHTFSKKLWRDQVAIWSTEWVTGL